MSTGLSVRSFLYLFSKTNSLHRGRSILDAMFSMISCAVFLDPVGRSGHECDLLPGINLRASMSAALASKLKMLLGRIANCVIHRASVWALSANVRPEKVNLA